MGQSLIVALASVEGIAIEATGTQVLSAQDLRVKRTMLIQTDFVGADGK